MNSPTKSNDTFGHLDVLARARHARALYLADAMGNLAAYVVRLFKGHDKRVPSHGKAA